MIIKNIIKTIFLSSVLAFSAQSAKAQDRLALQAPVDRRVNTLDTMVINRLKGRRKGRASIRLIR